MKYSIYTLLLAGMVFGGCYSNAEVGVTDKEIIVGAHTTESGPLAAVAAIGARGAAAYFDYINEKGGIYGRKIKWLNKDSQSLAPKTVEVTRQLVEQDKIFAMVYGMGPSHNSVGKYMNENNVPDIFFSDGASTYNDPSMKMSYQLYASYELESRIGALWFAKNHKGKKLCVLLTKDTLGEDFNKGILATIEESNAKAIDKDKITFGPTSHVDRMDSQADTDVLKFKEAKCDGVITSAFGPLIASAINYGFSQGYKPTWVIENVSVNAKFIGLVNESARENVYSTALFARQLAMTTKKSWDFYEGMMKKNNVPAEGNSTVGFSAAESFVEVLKRAGKDLTRDSLLKAAGSFNKDWQCTLCLNKLSPYKDTRYMFGEPKMVAIKKGVWELVK